MIEPSPYWATVDLDPPSVERPVTPAKAKTRSDRHVEERKAALARAHEIRQFEIELYWKRATYFWVLQAAVFTAVGLTWKFEDLDVSPVLPVALAALGCVTSIAGWTSAKGSKFWQENWEYHIDMLEDEFEGRLHKTAYVGKRGIAWSVSGVNDRMAIFFGVFWLIMLAATTTRANPSWFASFSACFAWAVTPAAQTGFVFLGLILAALALWRRRTKFEDAHAVSLRKPVPVLKPTGDIDTERLSSVADLAELGDPFLIRRVPKG